MVCPTGKRISVKVIKEEKIGSFYMAGTDDGKEVIRAKVVAIGTHPDIEVKSGDIVLIPKFGGYLTLNKGTEDELAIVMMDNIVAIER